MKNDDENVEWLKNEVDKEKEKIPVPDSLSPENVRSKIDGINQNSSHRSWKKTAMWVASFLLVVGVSVQVGRVIESKGGSKSSNESCETNDMKSDDSNQVAKEAEQQEDSTDEKSSNLRIQSFQEGNGNTMVHQGDIVFYGIEKDLVVADCKGGTVKEISRMAMNQKVKEFQLVDNILACIISDGNGSTTVNVFGLDDVTHPQTKSTISVGGNYQCSYLINGVLYFFTDTGSVQRMDVRNNQTTSFSVEEKNAKYCMSEDSVYTISKDKEGTVVQRYGLDQGSMQKKEKKVYPFDREQLLDVAIKNGTLNMAVADEEKVALYQLDTNGMKEKKLERTFTQSVVGAEYTEAGLYVLTEGTDSSNIELLDFQAGNTLKSVVLSGATNIVKRTVADDGSYVAVTTGNDQDSTYEYRVYETNNSDELTQKACKNIAKDIENELYTGSMLVYLNGNQLEVQKF